MGLQEGEGAGWCSGNGSCQEVQSGSAWLWALASHVLSLYNSANSSTLFSEQVEVREPQCSEGKGGAWGVGKPLAKGVGPRRERLWQRHAVLHRVPTCLCSMALAFWTSSPPLSIPCPGGGTCGSSHLSSTGVGSPHSPSVLLITEWWLLWRRQSVRIESTDAGPGHEFKF